MKGSLIGRSSYSLSAGLLIAILLCSCLIPALALAQPENFDSVSVPSLPTGWLSHTTTSGQAWKTVNDFSDTAPNSAFFHGTSDASRVTLDTPTFFRPKVPTTVSFRHKFNFEGSGANYYDGGRLYVTTGLGNYGEQFELTAAGGSFSVGGYNGTIASGSGSFVPGASAWVANSAGFITTTAQLPLSSPSAFESLSWGFQSDGSVLSPGGWWIDSITISPTIDLNMAVSINPNPAILGAASTLRYSVNNPSSLLATNVSVNIVLPVGFNPSTVSTNLGVASLSQNVIVVTFPAILAGETAIITVNGSILSTALTDYALRVTSGENIFKKSYGLRHLNFSPAPPNGVISTSLFQSFDFFDPVNDACQSQAIGSSGIGKIMVAAGDGCSMTQKALNVQTAGAIALVVISPNANMVVADEDGAGVTIPIFLASQSDIVTLPIAAGSGFDVELQALPSTLLSSAVALGDQFDAEILNNSATLTASAEADDDGDGVVNSQDQCPSDSKKVFVGVCGCNKPDSDKNKNGIIDCLINQDLMSQVKGALKLLNKVQPLNGLSGKTLSSQNKTRAKLKSTVKNITSIVSVNQAGILVSSSKIKVKSLSSAASKSVNSVLNANLSGFNSAKLGAKKSLNKLLKGII